ncbi:MAG: acetate--CoA ligase family protein [Desulfocucumaceae bacterium]
MTSCADQENAAVQRLKQVFNPGSVAVLGVTDSVSRVGYNMLQSLLEGGFRGRVYPVHPRLEEVMGLKVYHSLADIPDRVDLALIALNERATIEAIGDCSRKGIKGAVCVAGGFRETGEEGAALEEDLRRAARDLGVSLIGPNTLGFVNNQIGLYAFFHPMRLPVGGASLICQSGGVGMSLLYRAADAGLGINKWVGVGNRSTFEFDDYLAFLGEDETTTAIGVFVEGTENAGRMVRTAGALKKPVVIYKVGRNEAVDFAALTHTGSMAGSYRVYRDVFGQFGLHAVDSITDMVACLQGLTTAPPPPGKRVGIFTHTAGPSIVVADLLAGRGCELPHLSGETLEEVRKITGPNPPFILKNPLDVAGFGFQAGDYGQLLEIMAKDPFVDLVMPIYCHHKNWRFPGPEIVRARERSGKTFVACYLCPESLCRDDRQLLKNHGIPLFTTPEEAAVAAAALVARGERIRMGVGK